MGENGIILGFTLRFSLPPSLPNFCLPLPPAPLSADAGTESFPGVTPRGSLCCRHEATAAASGGRCEERAGFPPRLYKTGRCLYRLIQRAFTRGKGNRRGMGGI